MPRKSKIPPAKRRDWLVRHEHGERQDDIAKKDDVNPRTVSEQIERARLERAFEAAEQEQLRIALHGHQEDMLGLVKRLELGLYVVPVDFAPSLTADFGLHDSMTPPEQGISPPIEVRLGESVTVSVHEGWPKEIRLTEEHSRIWRALKEHLGNRHQIWRSIADWRSALLMELQARAELNQAIKKTVEVSWGLQVLIRTEAQEPRLTPTLVHLVRIEVTKRALGEPASDLTSRLEVRGGSVFDRSSASYLTEYLENPEKVKEEIQKIVESLVGSTEAEAAARAHRDLQDRTRKVSEELEDYRLLHHIPGRCSLCKKLGGQ